MPSYGTSEQRVFSSRGELETIEVSNKTCVLCAGSAAGPTRYNVTIKNPTIVELMCPNCGEHLRMFRNEYDAEMGLFKNQVAKSSDYSVAAQEAIEAERLRLKGLEKEKADKNLEAMKRVIDKQFKDAKPLKNIKTIKKIKPVKKTIKKVAAKEAAKPVKGPKSSKTKKSTARGKKSG